MADLDSSAQLAKEALDELRQAGSLSAKTLDKLNAAIKANTKETKDSADAIEEEAKAREKLTKDLIGLARNIGSAAQAVRENREDFRSLGPAVDATAQGIKLSMGGVAKGMDALGSVLSGVGAVLPGWGKLVGVFGGALSGASKAVQKYGAEAVDAAAQYAKFSLEEVQRVVGAFRELGEVGGITGDSMRGLQRDAIALGLSVDTYAKLIARNSQGLASVAGTVTGGAQVIKEITTAGTQFEDQFLKLGFSFEQQSEYSARFLAQQRNISRINLEDTKALSEANRKYLEEIDLLARVTGKSREKVASELEAAGRELRFGATLQLAEALRTKDAIFAAAQIIETQGGRNLAEGFKDIFGGVSTQRAIELQVATGGAAAQLADDLKHNRISLDEFMKRFKRAVEETGIALGGEGPLGGFAAVEERTGKLGTVLDATANEARRLVNAQDLSIEATRRAREEQEKAGKATGKEINNIVDAQKNLRDFARDLDKIVAEKLFPKMTTGIKYFTSVISEGAEKMAKILGVEGDKGGGASGASQAPAFAPPQQRPTTIGQPGPAPSDDYLSKVMKLESGGRNIGNQPVAGRAATSAHGLYQITKGTFEGIVANAPRDSKLKGKTFEDMKNDIDLQTEAMKLLTQENARRLGQSGLSTSDAAKYMAHMLGYSGASRVLGATGNTPISRLLSQEAIANNKLERFTTAAELRAEFDRRTGGGGYQYGGITSGPKSGYMSMLHGTEAVIPLPGGRSVPVEMTGMSDRMGEQVSILTTQVDRFDQMISLLQSSVDMQGKIYRATVN